MCKFMIQKIGYIISNKVINSHLSKNINFKSRKFCKKDKYALSLGY